MFGSGYTWPEFHYGARQWWLAGLAAAVMWMSEAVGAGEPRIYLPAIELVFCALSLLVPYGMYRFATQAYGERTGRLALVAGVGWYELVVLAPKPMTEFVAAGPLLLLMAAAARKEGARRTAKHGGQAGSPPRRGHCACNTHRSQQPCSASSPGGRGPDGDGYWREAWRHWPSP